MIDAPPAPAPRAHAAAMTPVRASWYGPGLYGNPLACGGTLTPTTVAVANKRLPCGTRVRLCYRGRCATFPVRDRGPFVAGRSFDLTAAARDRIGHPGGVQRVYYRRAS